MSKSMADPIFGASNAPSSGRFVSARMQAAAQFGARAAMAAALSALAACAQAPSKAELTLMSRSENKPLLPATRAERDAIEAKDLLSQAAFWGAEYDKSPTDYEASLKLARVLRGIGSIKRAQEVASQALTSHPADVELTLVYAQTCLDLGRPDSAVGPLARVESAALTDWRILSLVGVTMDQLDRHSDAQDYYRKALALAPDNVHILSNLALSYTLEGKPKLAEETLRKAVALNGMDERVRQNLVLVLGVQGKFSEAEAAVSPGTPKDLTEANVAYFRSLLTPARKWDALKR